LDIFFKFLGNQVKSSIYFAVKIDKIIQTHYTYQSYSRKLRNDLTVS